jgi:hypothetical protein
MDIDLLANAALRTGSKFAWGKSLTNSCVAKLISVSGITCVRAAALIVVVSQSPVLEVSTACLYLGNS